jgi:hypothetical protein
MIRFDTRTGTGETPCMLRIFGRKEILNMMLRLHNTVDHISGLS